MSADWQARGADPESASTRELRRGVVGLIAREAGPRTAIDPR